MPRVVVGLIGGSALLKSNLRELDSLKSEVVDTPEGRVFLRSGFIAADTKVVFVQRHDARPDRQYTQPSDVNYAAIALALKQKGVHFVIAICSVGSLKPSLSVGSVCVPDDFYCPWDLRRVFRDARAHVMPVISEDLRSFIIGTVRTVGIHPVTHGVYANAQGPRFETKAEIRALAAIGDVVGMTAAHEASACIELGLPYAMLSVVDNYANGVGPNFTVDEFHAQQAANLGVVKAAVAALLAGVSNPDGVSSAAAAASAVAGSAETAAAAPGSPAGSLSAPAAAAQAALAELLKTARKGEGEASADDSAMRAPAVSVSASAAPAVGGVPASPCGPTEVELIVNARWVVPVSPGHEQLVLNHHSVVVDGGRIVDILPWAEAEARYSPAKVQTLGPAHALMPGLVNAHTHLALNLLRGVADDMPLAQWLTEQIWPTEARLVSPDFVKVGTRLAVAECIKSGVTCVNDMYWFPTATAEVLEETGLRGMVSMVVIEFPMGGYATNAGEFISKGLQEREAWIAAHPKSRVRWGYGPHAPYTVSDTSFAHIKTSADALGLQVNLHLHETAPEVSCSRSGAAGPSRHLSTHLCSPFENLDRLGLLGPRLIAVHMTQLTESEITRTAETNTNVVHCPNSNMKLASGFCPVARLLKAGVNVALGTDSSSSNNSLDMLQELKFAAVLAKGVASDATAVPAWQALRMATLNGAIALGGSHDFGSLQVGKYADMVAVDLGGIDQQPMYNVLSHLVYACSRSCVTDVWVGGEQLLEGRRLTTIDEAAVLRETQEWAAKVRPGATAAHKVAVLPAEAVHHLHKHKSEHHIDAVE